MSAVVTLMSAGEAQRLTQRIKLTASGVRDGLYKLRNLVEEAKNSNVWQVLGFNSWTAYLADTLADEPMRLGRDERQELVGYLAGEGLSTRAIAPIVGVAHKTVARDLEAPVSNDTPAPAPKPEPEVVIHVAAETGEVIDAPTTTEHTVTEKVKTVTGLDGKTYTKPAPKVDRRRSLVDDAFTANTNLWKAVEAIRTIRNDDRFTRNKADILAALQPSADLANEILADLFNITTNKEN